MSRHSIIVLVFIISSIMFLPPRLDGKTIYVPDDCLTIQWAIDAAVNGDEIIVRPGIYVENIDFMGKAITVKSDQGAAVTTIDGNRAGSVVTIQSGEGPNSVLEGFVVTNGDAYYGGGIYCEYSSPTITNNTITDNTAICGGGGFAGPYTYATISNNTFTNNKAYYDGGGFYCFSLKSNPTISGNTFLGNLGDGGAINCSADAAPIITNNTISVNTGGDGGGIKCWYCKPTITNNLIADNDAVYGGGISCYCSSPNISNNIITGNTADTYGGGIYCYFCFAAVCNNTITENAAGTYGGGITCCGAACPIIRNSILWDNSAPEGSELYLDTGSVPTVRYSNIKGGWPGTGNIDADPLFADAANKDYHITWNSPCRDAGNNSAVTVLGDFEGDRRFAGGTVDMGADEFYYHLYLTGDAIPGGSFNMKVVGPPGEFPVRLALGSGVQEPPLPTQYGDLYLKLPLYIMTDLGTIPPDGVLVHSGTVPLFWNPGEEKSLQALVGPLGDPNSVLTNLMVLAVE